jgi:hypothetical protein
MSLLGVFVLVWGALVGVAYFMGLAIERMWGSGASLLMFLGLFFVSIYIAWQVAVRLTASQAVADRS